MYFLPPNLLFDPTCTHFWVLFGGGGRNRPPPNVHRIADPARGPDPRVHFPPPPPFGGGHCGPAHSESAMASLNARRTQAPPGVVRSLGWGAGRPRKPQFCCALPMGHFWLPGGPAGYFILPRGGFVGGAQGQCPSCEHFGPRLGPRRPNLQQPRCRSRSGPSWCVRRTRRRQAASQCTQGAPLDKRRVGQTIRCVCVVAVAPRMVRWPPDWQPGPNLASCGVGWSAHTPEFGAVLAVAKKSSDSCVDDRI